MAKARQSGSLLERAADRAVSIVSPRRAQLRAHFRRMEYDRGYRETMFAVLRAHGYRGARVDGKLPWSDITRSADAEILNDLPRLRNRCRELNRDDSIASGMTRTFVSNVIGTGIWPQSRTDDQGRDNRIEGVWRSRHRSLSPADNLTYRATQRLVYRKLIEDGDVLRKAVKRSPTEPIWFETIEADRLMSPMKAPSLAGGHEIRDGVERDASGIVVAYWIAGYHPGENVLGKGRSLPGSDVVRVESSQVCHIKDVQRPGQTRGTPRYHAILQDLRDLDLLLVAALKRTQVAACFAAYIKTTAQWSSMMNATAREYHYDAPEAMEPGQIIRLNPEEDMGALIPNFPTPELVPFVIMIARKIGAAVGVSWQVVLRDFSQSTYSSARSDQLETRKTFIDDQQMLIESWLDWEWNLVMQDAQLRGDGRLAGIAPGEWQKVEWITPGWKWVDPLKEAAGAKLELEMGSTTLQAICGSQGKDYESVMRQRAREKAMSEVIENEEREKAGLPPLSRLPDGSMGIVDSVADEIVQASKGRV